MEFKDLLSFIKREDERLKARYEITDKEKQILARTVKLGEEMGELCDEVLAYNALQRKDKLDKTEEGNLAEEFADVIVVSLLLANAMQVDIEKALEKKMEKIDKRYEKLELIK